MNNLEAVNIVNNIFSSIRKSRNVGDIQKIINNEQFNKKRMDEGKYPKLNLTLSEDDVKYLEDNKYITTEGKLVADISNRDDLTPLEKLLYSMSWKQGDLLKEQHIVNGVKSISQKHNYNNGQALVFYQFGRYLTKTNAEPIIDQHVMRAYMLHKCENVNDKEISEIRAKDKLYKTDIENINKYKGWLLSDEIHKDLKENDDYIYYVDMLLFAVGRLIKKMK